MNRLRFFFSLLFLILAPSAQAVSLHSICAWIMQNRAAPVEDRALLVDQLPKVTDLELPDAVGKYLKRNTSPDLKRVLKNTNVNFTAYDPNMNLNRMTIGEGLQSLFVARVVQKVEKRVNVCAEANCPADTKFILLHDPWQGSNSQDEDRFPTGTWQELPGYHALAMPLLKAANALYATLPKREALPQLALPAGLKIASIYGFRVNYAGSEFRQTLEDLQKLYPFKVLFISDSRDRDFAGIESSLPAGSRLTRLSHLSLGDLRNLGNDKLIVLNDTIGHLPQIQAFADIAIVRGPVDFLGPLQSGTPVIGLNDEASLRQFHRRGYARLQQLAEATGAAVFARALSELTPQDIAAIQKKNFPRPYQIAIDGPRTPIDLLISALNVHFR